MPALAAVALVAAAACAVAFVATGLAVRAAARLGLIDAPEARKSHSLPVPRSGGLGVALGLCAGLAVAWPASEAAGGTTAAEPAYLLPALGFLLLGLCDDRWRLRARTKLLGQAVLAAAAVALGLRWHGVALGPFPALTFGDLTPWMSGLWIVAVVTVVNFLDGIDLITSATTVPVLALAAAAGAGPGGGLLFAAVAGAVLGFAPWNVPAARAFLGDGGTHLLGFLVAAAALGPVEHPQAALPWPVVGGMLLPGVVDVAAGLVAKARRGVPLAAAHRDHPYQRLTRTGRGHAAVALRYGALVLLAALTVLGAGALGGGPAVAAAALGLGALLLGANLRQAARAPAAPAHFFDARP